MAPVYILAGILIGILIWLAIKIITLLERQNSQENQLNRSLEIQQNITERLCKIDAAQENLKQLSDGVNDLQSILTDKKTRGAFGEAQLENLVKNIIPAKYALMQKTLSNGCRPDCLINLPAPTNPLVIDAKFPLENFKLMANKTNRDDEYLNYKRQFKKDIKTHIDNISEKYIIPPETANSAIMFIPAEAIFAEIHAYNPDIVDYAHSKKVCIASPSTLVAILTTAAAVIKDNITETNLGQIHKQLTLLGKDFERFNVRINSLFKHIDACAQDANKVQISAQKISNRFQQIQEIDTLEEIN